MYLAMYVTDNKVNKGRKSTILKFCQVDNYQPPAYLKPHIFLKEFSSYMEQFSKYYALLKSIMAASQI